MRTIKRLCSDDPEALDLLDRVTVEKPGGDKKSEEAKINPYNVSNDSPADHGNSRQYAIRRLRKDRPDLHEQVLRKEMSAHAAMKEAGFIKEVSPLDLLKKYWANAPFLS